MSLIAGTAWIGQSAQGNGDSHKFYSKLISTLNAVPGVSASAESYTGGLANGTAITRLSVAASAIGSTTPDNRPVSRLEPIEVRLLHVIERLPAPRSGAGSTATRIVTTLVEEQASARVRGFIDAFNGSQPFVLESRINPGGALSHQLNVAPASWTTQAGDNHVDGARFDVEVESDGSFDGSGKLPGGMLSASTGTRFTLTEATQVFAGKFHSGERWEVKQSLQAGSFSATRSATEASASQVLRLADLTVESGVRSRDDQLDIQMHLSSDAVEAPLPIKRLGIDLLASNLAIPALGAPSWASLARGTLASGSTLLIDLVLGNRHGDFQALVDLVFGAEGFPADTDSMRVLGELIAALSGTISLSADRNVFLGTPLAALLSSPLASQAVDFDGSRYHSQLVLKDQVLKLNDRPLPLQFLLADFLARPLP